MYGERKGEGGGRGLGISPIGRVSLTCFSGFHCMTIPFMYVGCMYSKESLLFLKMFGYP